MENHFEKHRKSYGIAGAIAALLVAVIYLLVVPNETSESDGVEKLILQYGHSVCWLLLSLASYLWGIRKYKRVSAFCAYVALIMYVIFIFLLAVD